MITDKKLARINELARKAKAEGLTSAETKERDVLRREYIEAVRANLRGQLNNINIQELDGSITNLGEKYGKKVAAPKVFGEDMRYFYIHSYDDVAPGYFNIPEPDETRNLKEAADETALFLVPGVAFDKDRHRCGYGKGFYDRYLSRHTQHATVAMALDFQIVETVPSDVYDICPQMLITPTMIYGK